MTAVQGHTLRIEGQGIAGYNYRVSLDGVELAMMSLVLEMSSTAANYATIKVLVGAIEGSVEILPRPTSVLP